MNWKNLKLRDQIVIFAGSISLGTLIIIISIAIGLFVAIGKTTQNQVEKELSTQAEEFLKQSSIGLGQFIERKFGSFGRIVSIASNAASRIFSEHPCAFADRNNYFWWNGTTAPPDINYDPQFGYNASKTYSVFYLVGSAPENLSLLLSDEMTNDTINRSAHLDHFWKPMIDYIYDIGQIQIGFDANGAYRRYPGTDIPFPRDYDPRSRPWYTEAVQYYPNVAIAGPFLSSSTSQWMISASIVVKNLENDINFLGVSATQVALDTIYDFVNSQKIYHGNGYSILIHSEDGLILAHPDWDYKNTNQTTTLDILQPDLWKGIKKGIKKTTITLLVIKDKEWIISQTPVYNDLYQVISLVPKKIVLESANKISEKIEHYTHNVFDITMSIGGVTFVVVLIISIFLAIYITNPLKLISEIAMKIASNITETDKMKGINFDRQFAENDEIGAFGKAFKNMILKLQGKSTIINNEKEIEMQEKKGKEKGKGILSM